MYRNPCARLALAVTVACFLCAAGQAIPTTIDAGHSYASLWMGRQSETSVMVNVGVAQVGGTVRLEAKQPEEAALRFSLVPGGAGSQLLAPDGTLRDDVTAPIMRYTAMTFRSSGARIRNDGRLEITGELAVVHVTRERILPAWNSANDAPTYTDPKTLRSAKTVTFVLATPRVEFLAEYLQKHSDLVFSATVEAAAFPDLPSIVLDSDWPTVAEDEHCEPASPYVSPRDYSGWTCAGKAITTTPAYLPWQTTSVDYSGLRKYDAPADGPVTILLHLRFARSAGPATTPPAR